MLTRRQVQILDLYNKQNDDGSFPTMRDLAQKLGLSRQTICNELRVCRDEGVPTRPEGMLTYKEAFRILRPEKGGYDAAAKTWMSAQVREGRLTVHLAPGGQRLLASKQVKALARDRSKDRSRSGADR